MWLIQRLVYINLVSILFKVSAYLNATYHTLNVSNNA